MSDNKSQKIDDITDDSDFDLSDVEESDMGDDSWDEFDDEPKKISAKKNMNMTEAAPSGKKKSYLGIIIIFVVMIGGAVFFLSRSSGLQLQHSTGQETVATDTNAQNDVVELSDKSTPPMPAPIESGSENADISENAAAQPPVTPETSGGLTPLPPSSSQDEQKTASADLAPSVSIPLKAEPVAEEALAAAAPEDASVSTQTDAVPVAALSNDNNPVPAAVAATPENTERIDKIEQDVSSLRSDLSAKIDSTGQKVDSLAADMEAIQAKLEDISRATSKDSFSSQVEKKVASPSSDEPLSSDMPVSAKPEKNNEPKPVLPEVSAAPVAPSSGSAQSNSDTIPTLETSSMKWELRSAQPGKAILSPKGSGEMQTVLTGDTVPDLGRITSISLENGYGSCVVQRVWFPVKKGEFRFTIPLRNY